MTPKLGGIAVKLSCALSDSPLINTSLQRGGRTHEREINFFNSFIRVYPYTYCSAFSRAAQIFPRVERVLLFNSFNFGFGLAAVLIRGFVA
jgi:hypothetical protein